MIGYAPDHVICLQANYIYLIAFGIGDNQGLLTLPTLGNEKEKERVGRWGEHLIYKLMQGSLQGNIRWMNENEECGRPYDLVVYKVGNAASSATTVSDKDVDYYVEVKSTATAFDEESYRGNVFLSCLSSLPACGTTILHFLLMRSVVHVQQASFLSP